MFNDRGIWEKETARDHHVFSYRLAEYLAKLLPRDRPVFDFGCGTGAYSKYLRDVGFTDVTAIEGADLEELFETKVEVHDLSEPFNLRRAGSVVSLEVGEHIPGERMQVFLENLARHCSGLIVLTWAVVGQDGIGHVNNRDNYEIIGRVQELGFDFLWRESKEIREKIEKHCAWFSNTIMIFKKK